VLLFRLDSTHLRLKENTDMADNKYTAYCNMCGHETARNNDDPVYNGDCPYHQRVLSDGTLAWDEFDQDGCA
jgi:DNA primase catalytic subunit